MRRSGFRFAPSASSRIEIGALSIDRDACAATVKGAVLPLGSKVVATLLALHERAGDVVSKPALIERVWGDAPIDESSVWQNVHVLRGVLASHAPTVKIETVKGRGYRLVIETPVPIAHASRVPAWLWSIAGAAAASSVFAFVHVTPRPATVAPHRMLFFMRSNGPLPALPPLAGARIIVR